MSTAVISRSGSLNFEELGKWLLMQQQNKVTLDGTTSFSELNVQAKMDPLNGGRITDASSPMITNPKTLSPSDYDYGISLEEIDSWVINCPKEEDCKMSTLDTVTELEHPIMEAQPEEEEMGLFNKEGSANIISSPMISNNTTLSPSDDLNMEPVIFEGEMGLPCGFRFRPSDQELLLCYLASRLSGRMLSPDAVRHFDVYAMEPWLLPGAETINEDTHPNKSLYFFVRLRKLSEKCSRPERRVGNGFWRMSTSDVDIRDNQKKVIGYKRQLAYRMFRDATRNYKNAKNTSGVMHEYKLRQHQELTICKIKRNGRSVSTY